MNKMPTPMKFKSIEAKTVKSVSLSIISRALIITIAVGMSNCASLIAKKNTYGASGPAAKINGAEVRLQVNPQGAENGAFSLSAMVVSTTVATMEGPFRWRVEAIGDSSVHQSIVIHRIFTSTEKSKRKEWYPTAKLSKRADFREVKERLGKSRARYEIPRTAASNFRKRRKTKHSLRYFDLEIRQSLRKKNGKILARPRAKTPRRIYFLARRISEIIW